MPGVKSCGVEALVVVMLVRYQGQVAGFVGATRYGLSPELAARAEDDVDRRARGGGMRVGAGAAADQWL